MLFCIRFFCFLYSFSVTIATKRIIAFQVQEKEFEGDGIHIDGGKHGPVANLTAFLWLQHALQG